MQGQGWETPEGAGEVPANNSRHKSMAATRSSPLLSPGDRGHQHYKAKADQEQLVCGADPKQTLPVAPQAPLLLPVPHPTHPALLLLLLGVSVLAAANAGVAGDAVEAGDAVRGVLPLDAQLWGPPEKEERLGKEGSATYNSPSARAPYGPSLPTPNPSSHPTPSELLEPPCNNDMGLRHHMVAAREMPRAHITLLLSQAISLTAHCTHTGVLGLETALMGTKSRSAGKTGCWQRAWQGGLPRLTNNTFPYMPALRPPMVTALAVHPWFQMLKDLRRGKIAAQGTLPPDELPP